MASYIVMSNTTILQSNGKLSLYIFFFLGIMKSRANQWKNRQPILEAKTMSQSQVMRLDQRLIDVIAERLGMEHNAVTLDAHFRKDLHLDSLDGVDLLWKVEEVFEVQISDEQAANIHTVQDLFNFLEARC
jgi:acyl carrier protein